MRYILNIAIVLLIVGSASGKNAVYLTNAATGANDGTSCANAKAVSYFNKAGNWSATPTGIQIGPGTTVHLCGTLNGSAGTTMLTFHGSGASGSPITLLFEPNAVMTAPYWAGNPNGAISVGANSWIVIDGGTNGELNATANGTHLSYQTATYGITITTGSNVTIENMHMVNLYQRQPGGHELSDGSTVQGIVGGNGSNVIIQNNTIHDTGWAITSSGDNNIIRNNTIYHVDHGAAPNGPHWYFYGNHVYDWAVWDSDNNAYHHDGVHCYANRTVQAWIYNNRFDGAWGGNFNQPIFLEGGDSPTKCFVNGGTSYSFNNIEIGTNCSNFGGPPMGGSTTTNNGDIFANNLEIADNVGRATPQGLALQNIPNANCPTCGVSYYNNAVSNIGTGVVATVSRNNVMNYDAFESCSSVAGCYIGGRCNGCATIADWRAASGYETHGIANQKAANNAYFKLGSGCVPGSIGADCAPQARSPLIGAGKNLFSMCDGQPNPGLGALCFDINGNSRPSTESWDIGPYQSGPQTSRRQR
jgi:hypothetical protein